MKDFLFEKLNEIREKIQKTTVDRINLGMSLTFSEKLNNSFKQYDCYLKRVKSILQPITTTTLGIFGILICLYIFPIELDISLKMLIGAVSFLDGILVFEFFDEIKGMYKEKNYLQKNGYDPQDEEQMENLKSNQEKLRNEYIVTDVYLNNLIERKEDLQFIIDKLTDEEDLQSRIVDKDLFCKLEKYPELLEEYFNNEFTKYLDEVQKIRPKDVDLEPTVEKEDLVAKNLRQLILK